MPLRAEGDMLLLRVKAVPGASRDLIAGVLGDRLKIKVAAPPEGGRANDAIRELLAKALGVKARDVTIESGQASTEKVVRIGGVSEPTGRRRLGIEQRAPGSGRNPAARSARPGGRH